MCPGEVFRRSMPKNRKISSPSAAGTERRRAVISTAGTALLGLIGLVVAVVIATPLRMRDVLHVIGGGLGVGGRALKTGTLAFAKFWADVFRAILPEKGDRDDDEDIEVDE